MSQYSTILNKGLARNAPGATASSDFANYSIAKISIPDVFEECLSITSEIRNYSYYMLL
jgi:hypothetical protein